MYRPLGPFSHCQLSVNTLWPAYLRDEAKFTDHGNYDPLMVHVNTCTCTCTHTCDRCSLLIVVKLVLDKEVTAANINLLIISFKHHDSVILSEFSPFIFSKYNDGVLTHSIFHLYLHLPWPGYKAGGELPLSRAPPSVVL